MSSCKTHFLYYIMRRGRPYQSHSDRDRYLFRSNRAEEVKRVRLTYWEQKICVIMNAYIHADKSKREENHMKTKAVSIIGGADGPTSVFIAGKFSRKQPLKVRIRQNIYRYRRKRAAKRISPNPHTLKELIAYADKKYHTVEIPKTDRRYIEQYTSAKEGLIIMHRPELLGELAEIKRPETFDEEAAKELCRQSRLRSEMAASIPDSEMPMDFHIYEIKLEDGHMEIGIDFRWDIFGMSYSGNKKTMKKLKKISQELHMYYGVSGEDIRNETKRYSMLLTALSS